MDIMYNVLGLVLMQMFGNDNVTLNFFRKHDEHCERLHVTTNLIIRELRTIV